MPFRLVVCLVSWDALGGESHTHRRDAVLDKDGLELSSEIIALLLKCKLKNVFFRALEPGFNFILHCASFGSNLFLLLISLFLLLHYRFLVLYLLLGDWLYSLHLLYLLYLELWNMNL